MFKKRMFKVVLASCLLAQGAFAYAGGDIMNQSINKPWKFEFGLATSWVDDVTVLEGDTSDAALTGNLNRDDRSVTLTPTVGLIVPITNYNNYSFSALTNLTYVPLHSVTTTSDSNGSLKINGHRYNVNVGVDVSHPIQNNCFVSVRAGGGVSASKYQYTALDDQPGGSDNERGEGFNTNPFASFQIALGKEFSQNRTVQLFFRVDTLFNANDNVRLAGNGGDETYAIIDTPKNMFSIGISASG